MSPRRWQWTGLAAGLGGFALVWLDDAAHGPLYRADQPIYDALSRWNARLPLRALGDAATQVVSVPWAVAITALAVVAWWLLRDRRMAAWGAVSGMAAGAAIYALKQSIRRPLPPVAAGAWYKYSFPSGHTISATANVGLLILLGAQVVVDRRRPGPDGARRVWYRAVGLWVAFAVLMGIGRILTQRHWASDVVGSWFVGLALACATLLAAR